MAGSWPGLSDALQHLGAKRVEAILVAFLAHEGGVDTKRIVEATGLRQPEVSVGMRELRDRDWVEAEPIPRKQKGRPMNRYRLAVDTADVRRHYERMAEDTIRATRSALDEVRKALA